VQEYKRIFIALAHISDGAVASRIWTRVLVDRRIRVVGAHHGDDGYGKTHAHRVSHHDGQESHNGQYISLLDAVCTVQIITDFETELLFFPNVIMVSL
jgi:hypothetical protein